MHLNAPTVATIALVACGAVLSAPVLYQGFRRRGKGVVYESNFMLQRAPQLISLLNVPLIFASFVSFNGLFHHPRMLARILSLGTVMSNTTAMIVSWIGVAIFVSGLVFMIGGWYSLGEAFSTDAELLEGQTVRRTGLLNWVMHPAYSGIIQSLLGASVTCISPLAIAVTLLAAAPLWLNRAKYEEQLLMKTFGTSYEDYARALKWRRLVPRFFPLGV